jgi:YesN/AraC family two-component response regulator
MKKQNRPNLIDILKYTKELKVLYVEDETNVREKFGMMLENIFDTIDSCESARSALELYEKYNLQASPYDIVIADMYMPDMDGLEFSQTVLKLNPDQKILAISAYNDSKVLESLIDLGVSNYIQKPVKKDRLIDVIYKTALEVSRQKEESELKNLDLSTGVKNRHCLEKDIKNLPDKNIILIKLKNLNTIQTIYGNTQTDALIKNFTGKFKKHFNDDKDLYRLSSKKFAYIIDKTINLEKAIKTMLMYSQHCKFDIVISASEEKDLIPKADMALDFAIRHGLEYKIYSKEIDLTDEYKNRIFFKSILDNAIE